MWGGAETVKPGWQHHSEFWMTGCKLSNWKWVCVRAHARKSEGEWECVYFRSCGSLAICVYRPLTQNCADYICAPTWTHRSDTEMNPSGLTRRLISAAILENSGNTRSATPILKKQAAPLQLSASFPTRFSPSTSSIRRSSHSSEQSSKWKMKCRWRRIPVLCHFTRLTWKLIWKELLLH